MTDFVHLWVWELSTKPTVFSHMAGDIFSVKPFQSFNNNTFLHIVHSVLRENLCKLLQSPVKDNSHSPLQEYLDRKIMSTERRKMVWTQEWHTFIEKDHLGDSGVLIRTVADNWRFDSLCRSHLHLDSEDGFRSGCRNVSHQQHSFSRL